nr:hypothetical protein [Mucilaginibacter sp. L294]
MKNQLFAIAIICTLFLGCGKKDIHNSGGDKSEGTMSCKINGKLHEFNYSTNANDKPSTGKVQFVVIGGWEQEDINKSPGFGIHLLVPSGAEEKAYSVAGTNSLELDGDYYIQNFKDGKLVSTTTFSGGRTTGTNFTLKITSLTSWGVTGTFSGKLKLTGGEEYLNITEGQFSAPYN